MPSPLTQRCCLKTSIDEVSVTAARKHPAAKTCYERSAYLQQTLTPSPEPPFILSSLIVFLCMCVRILCPICLSPLSYLAVNLGEWLLYAFLMILGDD